MKRMIIAISLMLVASVLTGCNRAKDRVLPDGTKIFGERTQKDGTHIAEREEFPNGEKDFDVTWLNDGSRGVGRTEFPDGEKRFEITFLPDGTAKIGRDESPNGEKQFDVTQLPDGTRTVATDTDLVRTSQLPSIATTSPVAQAQAQTKPFTFHGVHAGMTVAELKGQHRNQVQCVNTYSHDRHHTPAIECAFDESSSRVSTYFFLDHLFYIVWSCEDHNCSKAIAAMKAHYGKPESSKEESVSAEVGGFREHVITWRSPQETASVVGEVQFEVFNYDFASPNEQRR